MYKFFALPFVSTAILVAGCLSAPAQTTLIPAGSVWKFHDSGIDPGSDWTQTGYNDASWNSGPAPLGYGDPVSTTVSFGPQSTNKHITTWFRRSFVVDDPSAFGSLEFQLRRDDGAVVHLNSQEVFRSNMPGGTITPQTFAPSPAVSGSGETSFYSNTAPNTLQAGLNVVAVEIHQVGVDSSDVVFDLKLEAEQAQGGGSTNTVAATVREPLGPSSTRSDLVFSEIQYHPRGDDPNLEFIELVNTGIVTRDLTGWRLSGEVSYVFPAGTSLAPGAFLVVALNPTLIQTTHGITGVLGPWTGQLSDSGGTLRLRNARDAILLEVNYNDNTPWPVSADGTGHSLVLAHASRGESFPEAWEAGDRIGGTPGQPETWTSNALDAICLNEVLLHSVPPAEDYIELLNRSAAPVDLSGAWLTDNAATNKFQIPNGTTIGARGFQVFNQSTLGFALDAEGESVFLIVSNQTRVIDAQKIGAQAPDVPVGRVPNGSPQWSELTLPSPGASNGPALDRPIVINEIHYHPLSQDDADEFVELYNRGNTDLDVGGWRFVDGIDVTLPTGTVIPAQGFLVVARDAAHLQSKYAQLNSTNLTGNYAGTLDNSGERIRLAMPVSWLVTNGPAITTNTTHVVVDEVSYKDGGRWGQWSDRGGSSLELVDPRADNRLAPNWADSDETGKAPWTTIEFTGPLDNGRDTLNEVHAMILGSGEVLMDDVEFNVGGGGNLVLNPGFETGLTDWWLGGNHIRSSLENTGFSGTMSLHLRATAAGDTGANRVECDLTQDVSTSGAPTATLRAKFRWLRGHPDVLLRVQGNYIEAVGTLTTPADPGTPGLPNSTLLPNAGPAITDVSHSPVLPAANQPVLVTARVHDPDGVAGVNLRYRLDPATGLQTLAMRDDGTGGDACPGDGVFTAILPAQSANILAAYHIIATDGPSAATRYPAVNSTECLVLFGQSQPAGSLGVYRLWMTSANRNAWINREKMSNEPIEGTLVYGDSRVIHGAGARYRGSPFTRPGYNVPDGDQCGYIWNTPADEPFLGGDELNLDSLEPGAGGTGRDETSLREVTAFTMADQLGLPFSHQRFIRLYFNGISNTDRNIPVYSHSQQMDSDYVRSWFPGEDDGVIYKIDDWFEFGDERTGSNSPKKLWNENGRLNRYTTTGGTLKKARYRWSWERKFNRGADDDYSTLFDLVETVNAPAASYVQRMEASINLEEWLTMFALRHSLGDYDGYGYSRGKNQFIYLPPQGKWSMLLWDLDFSLGCNGGRSTTDDIFSHDGGDASLNTLYNHSHFQRIYYRALERCMNGPFIPSKLLPTLTERYAAFQAEGINTVSPFVPSGRDDLSIPDWASARRTFVLGQIPSASFAVTSPAGSSLITGVNVVTFSGTAPVAVARLLVNGQAYPVTWNGPVNWSLQVPLSAAVTVLSFSGVDAEGATIPGISHQVTVTYTGALPDARDHLVINEIAYDRSLGTEFVELLNTSTGFTFDVSGWRLNGVDYTFPGGAVIRPGERVVLMKDRVAFNLAHPTAPVPFDKFPGNFDPDGETLSLKQVYVNPPGDRVIDQVRYEIIAPWPTNVPAPTASLQLRDAARDNARVSNWTNAPASPGAANPVATALPAYPGLWLNEVQPENSAGLTDRFGEPEPWIEIVNDSSSPVSLNGCYLSRTYANPTEWAFPSGSTVPAGGHLLVFLDGETSEGTPAEPHAGFRPTAGTGSLAFSRSINGQAQLLDYFNYTAVFAGQSYGSLPDAQPFYRQVFGQPTPGQPNDSILGALPVRLNEFMAVNNNTIQNPLDGAYDDWIELINLSSASVGLAGYYLTDILTNATQWVFPGWAAIGPYGRLLVWADGHPEYNDPTNASLHANFKLSAAGEQLGLFAADGTAIDTFTFGPQSADISMGRCEEGIGAIALQGTPTPGLANACAPPEFSGATLLPDGRLQMTWSATPGRYYQVLYKNALEESTWLELAPASLATSTIVTVEDPITNQPGRFYRLLLLP